MRKSSEMDDWLFGGVAFHRSEEDGVLYFCILEGTEPMKVCDLSTPIFDQAIRDRAHCAPRGRHRR